MLNRRVLATSVLGLSTLLAPACYQPPYNPPVGDNFLGVNWIAQQTYYYCIPAAIEMWGKWLNGPNWGTTQQQIWNWVDYNLPGQAVVGTGIRWDPAASTAAGHFLSRTLVTRTYTGTDGVRHAVADQQWGIANQTPTLAAIFQTTHAGLVIGVTWTRLSDTEQRPRVDYVKMLDPAAGSPGAITWVVLGDWMFYTLPYTGFNCTTSTCAMQVMYPGLYYGGTTALQQFEDESGTYSGPPPPNPTGRWKGDGWGGCYWEPNDSGPDQCSGSTPTGRWKSDGNGGCYWEPNDSGPDQCVPPHASTSIGNSVREGFRLAGLLGRLTIAPIFKQPASLATRVRQPSLSTGTKMVEQGQRSTAQPTAPSANSVRRNGTKAPHPYATSTQEILENVIAAFQQTRLGESSMDPRLGDRAGELRVRRLLDVKSLTNRPDYYVVELDNAQGASVARAAITKDGSLMQVQTFAPGASVERSGNLKDVTTVARNFVDANVVSARYVFIENVVEMGNPVLMPLIQVETAAGRLYLNSRHEAFAEENSALDKAQRDESVAAPAWRGALNLRKLIPAKQ